MKKQRLKSVCSLLLLCLIGISLGMIGCSDADGKNGVINTLNITAVSIPSRIAVTTGGEIILSGKGFAQGDEIQLTAQGDAGKVYTALVDKVAAETVTFSLPEGVSTGTYLLRVVRGERSLLLGTVTFEVSANNTLPDREGMTVKGVVSSAGVGVAGVVVSDGTEVTVTDKQGIYYLPSAKETGFVFISIPGNYEVTADGNAPQFYQRLSEVASVVEQKNFTLNRVDNTDHILLAMADMHLADRNDDISQFRNGFLADANQLISSYQVQGKKVYGLTLGDQSWDVYWYERKYALPEAMKEIQKIGCPVFNCMGNHDNDPYVANDWLASLAFRKMVGPTYYSFNLGDVHYVVLDDIKYLNTGGGQGTVGERNYTGTVVAEQIAWLKKDLAALTDKTKPVVVALHIPVHANPTTVDSQGVQTDRVSLLNGNEVLACLDGFTQVHILSGHTHINFSVESSAAVMEHNTAAICATWWWTGKSGYAGNQICKDGSPGGYGVWEMQGKQTEWYYKSIGFDRNYQFRTYDRNTIRIDAAFTPNATGTYAEQVSTYAGNYAAPSTKNEVLINVWGYDPSWKIEVTEGGNALPVTRIVDKDPLHIISYELQRLNVNANPTEDFVTNRTAHLFKVTASAANTTLNIKVTDRFGIVYTESMARPKAFSYSMK